MQVYRKRNTNVKFIIYLFIYLSILWFSEVLLTHAAFELQPCDDSTSKASKTILRSNVMEWE